MNRKKIVIRSLLVLIIPLGVGLYEIFTDPAGMYAGLSTMIYTMGVTTVEVIILLLVSVIQYIRAAVVRSKPKEDQVLEATEGKYLRLQRSGGSFLLAAVLVALTGIAFLYGFILLLEQISQ